jgi:hypothetical protein
MPNLELEKKLDHNAKPIKVDNIITPLEVSTDKLWYQKTPTDTYEVVNKKYVDDNSSSGDTTQYWHEMIGGYKTNNTSTTTYYTFYRVWYENWSNSDSSPTSVTSTDTYSAFFIAPRAGSITNIKVQGRASDTGATDPFKFYFFKMALSNNDTSKTATAMMTTSAITPPTANRTFSYTEDFSSNNTFSEDDNLYVWLKKDSNSGNQDLYWNICINGEYSG